MALLGSEEAVRRYIDDDSALATRESQMESQVGADPSGPKDLFGNPIPQKPSQKKLF